MTEEYDDRNPDRLDTITWRERVVTRLAILEERTKHIKSRVDDLIPHVHRNSDFTERTRAIDQQHRLEKAAASARNAFLVALGSVLVSLLGILLQYLGVI